MLKYLVIQLSDNSVSYCHYENIQNSEYFMPLEILKQAIRFGMTENLNIQFVYPKCKLPIGYAEEIETTDHIKIIPCNSENAKIADCIVCNGIKEVNKNNFNNNQIVVLRICRDEIIELPNIYEDLKNHCLRLNIVVTDIEKFSDDDFNKYDEVLNKLGNVVAENMLKDNPTQISLLSDRIFLKEMKNCNAGDEVMTIMPNGRFYPCAGFFYDNPNEDFGDLNRGVEVKNKQLFKIDYAPICRNCDAFHCHRCVWLNRKTTFEVNTPSHEQCVASHLERNESSRILSLIQEEGEFFSEISIDKKDCLDPFEDIINNKINL